MNVAVTGSNGFIGSYLVNSLVQRGYNVYSISRSNTSNLAYLRKSSNFLSCDFGNQNSIKNTFDKLDIDMIYHLAAQSNIPLSWKDPITTFNVNVNGTLTLLEIIRNSKADSKIHIVCSSSEYGSVEKKYIPIHEEVPFQPSSPYAVSKVTEDMLGYSYWKSYGMKITRSRPFAITGPGKNNDVMNDWAQNVVEIEAGTKKELVTGNLSATRDFLDVRDCVSALITIADKGKIGDVYNVCSGIGTPLGKIIEIFKSLSKKPFKRIQDPQRLRPSDDPILVGTNDKLKNLGWASKFSIEQSIDDILNFYRDMN
jgi:GDP-4-dehydro-6-deoxy-D-mannose reductase